MNCAYLDTHVCVWLHDGILEQLSPKAKALLNSCELLLVSPMVLLEFDYLRKRNRIRTGALEMMTSLTATFGAQFCTLPFEAVAANAIRVDWTADPFDRLIVSQAISRGAAPLITKDRVIRAHYHNAVW